MATDPQQVVQDTRDFVEHRADVSAALWHLDLQQLLDRQTVSVLVGHRRHIVETIHVRHGLHPGTGLGKLFGTPMKQTDMRVGIAGRLRHPAQAQDAVRRALPGAADRS